MSTEILTTPRARGYDVCSGVGVDYDDLLAALPCPHCHEKAVIEAGVCGHCSEHVVLTACQIGAAVRLSGRVS